MTKAGGKAQSAGTDADDITGDQRLIPGHTTILNQSPVTAAKVTQSPLAFTKKQFTVIAAAGIILQHNPIVRRSANRGDLPLPQPHGVPPCGAIPCQQIRHTLSTMLSRSRAF
jgi:hypothetical protein